jgi:hypothetical protein
MGEAKQRKIRQRRFLEEHNLCCFCGGTIEATTVDHVPARTCFKGRAYPETFEFPACQPCNAASRIDEIAFSFFVKKMGVRKPEGRLFSEMPMAEIPDAAHGPIERYGRKIACALYYRERGRAASVDHQVVVSWGQLVDRRFLESVEGFLAMPHLEVGARRNVQFGNQFAYRHVGADDPDIFGFIAQFGTGLVLAGMVAAPPVATRMLADGLEQGIPEGHAPWIAVRDIYRSYPENAPAPGS